MERVFIFIILFISYLGYSALVFTKGTDTNHIPAVSNQQQINRGMELFQKHNCISCHQIYGLGGYLGTDLTKAWSDKSRGEFYINALLKNGGSRMPGFHFNDEEIEAIAAYLKNVDVTAGSYR